MIRKLRSAHYGKSIAVIGSGPTAKKYSGKEQVAIGLNKAITLNRRFDYFMAFDTTLAANDWFPLTLDYPRILGFELSQMLAHREQDCIFRYTDKRKIPELPYDFTELTNLGNIAIPAVELALLMGAHRLVLYGIDLNQRVYFDGERGKAHYGVTAPRYMQTLLGLAQCNEIDVEVVGSEDCKINLVR